MASTTYDQRNYNNVLKVLDEEPPKPKFDDQLQKESDSSIFGRELKTK